MNGADEGEDQSKHQAHIALKALQSVGGLHWWTILWFVFLVMLVNIFSGFAQDGFETIYTELAKSFALAPAKPADDAPFWPVLRYELALVGGVAFILWVVVWRLKRKAERHLGEVRPRVIAGYPPTAKVVVMFVSVPTKISLISGLTDDQKQKLAGKWPDELVKIVRNIRFKDVEADVRALLELNATEVSATARHDRASLIAEMRRNAYEVVDACSEKSEEYIRALFNGANWRMNAEALRPHIMANSILETVVVIPSKQSATGSAGSQAVVETFVEYLATFLKHNCPRRVSVLRPSQIEVHRRGAQSQSISEAVNGESMPDLVEMLYLVNAALRRSKSYYTEEDILVDITSGKSLSTAAGMAFATLVDKRRVQYVDTIDYSINVYDVVHDVDQL